MEKITILLLGTQPSPTPSESPTPARPAHYDRERSKILVGVHPWLNFCCRLAAVTSAGTANPSFAVGPVIHQGLRKPEVNWEWVRADL